MWLAVFAGGGETLAKESPSETREAAADRSHVLLSDPFRVSGRANAAEMVATCRASASQMGYQMFCRMRLAQIIGPTTLVALPTAVKKKKTLTLPNMVSGLLRWPGLQLTGVVEE